MTAITPLIAAGELHQLKGRHVSLKFLQEAYREKLRPLARNERIWEYTKAFLITETYDQQFDTYFDEALSIAGTGGQAFVILDSGAGGARAAGEGQVIGMTRVYDVDRKVKKATIGFTWYIPEVWGLVHNKECKLLLLQYLFDKLGFVRVDFKVASQNIRSQKAVMKIGGIKEAVLRKFALRNDGTQSDTFIFSILDEEWAGDGKKRLEEMVTAERGA